MKPGQGVLLVTHSITPEARAECDEWYMRQHLPERVGLPGFLRGRRFQHVSGEPRYLAWYETHSPGVLHSQAYEERLANPTSWTRRVMPNFRDMSRSVLRVELSLGDLDGGFLGLIPLADNAGVPDIPRIHAVLAAAARKADICAAHLLTATEDAPAQTVESHLRGGEDRSLPAAIVIEGTSESVLDLATADLLVSLDSIGSPMAESYRLMFSQYSG
ncbi:MAG: hypothetical protein GC151_13605 [Betaproteobacteria bacterium]|nr:hypothetical protein [Betaproteobacteria bacterium]